MRFFPAFFKKLTLALVCGVALTGFLYQPVQANDKPFVSLTSDEVNMRTGPGYRYPIDWVYQKEGLPVRIIDRFEHWRQIEDFQGTKGWVHRTLLSTRRTALTRAKTTLFEDARSQDDKLALLEPELILYIETCQTQRCEVIVNGVEGWVDRAALWGATQISD